MDYALDLFRITVERNPDGIGVGGDPVSASEMFDHYFYELTNQGVTFFGFLSPLGEDYEPNNPDHLVVTNIPRSMLGSGNLRNVLSAIADNEVCYDSQPDSPD